MPSPYQSPFIYSDQYSPDHIDTTYNDHWDDYKEMKTEGIPIPTVTRYDYERPSIIREIPDISKPIDYSSMSNEGLPEIQQDEEMTDAQPDEPVTTQQEVTQSKGWGSYVPNAIKSPVQTLFGRKRASSSALRENVIKNQAINTLTSSEVPEEFYRKRQDSYNARNP